MVAMGGGSDLPIRESKGKELVLCALPWPRENAQKGIKELEDIFGDVEVEYFHTVFNNGKMEALDISEGMSFPSVQLTGPKGRCWRHQPLRQLCATPRHNSLN